MVLLLVILVLVFHQLFHFVQQLHHKIGDSSVLVNIYGLNFRHIIQIYIHIDFPYGQSIYYFKFLTFDVLIFAFHVSLTYSFHTIIFFVIIDMIFVFCVKCFCVLL